MLLFTDGCDSYTTTTDLLYKWATIPSTAYAAGGGKYGSGAIQVSDNAQCAQTKKVLGGGNRILGCCWMQSLTPGQGGSAPENRKLIAFFDTAGNEGGGIMMYWQNQAVSLGEWNTNAFSNGTPLAFGTKNLVDGLPHFIEWDILFDNTVGHFYVYVDRTLEISYVGDTVASGTPDIQYMAFGSTLSSSTINYSHIVLYDNNGVEPTSASFPLNQVRIDTIRPDGDTATTQFSTLSSGTTHYNLVNEQTPNTTDYVQDSTVGHTDLYTFGNMNFVPTAVIGVMQNVYCENEGGTTINYKMTVKSGATLGQSSNIQAPAAYFTQQFGFPTDPNTGTAWTQTTINSINAGFEDRG